MRVVLWLTLACAIAVFCIVQDRVTAEGARRYVSLQKEALARGHDRVNINEVMQPAVVRSVRLASIASGAVLAAGVVAAFAVRGRHLFGA